MVDFSGFTVMPAVVMGLIIGLLEMFFVHSDEKGIGLASFMHGLHAVPFCILFVFVSMNVSTVYNMLNIQMSQNMAMDLGVRVFIGLVAIFKITGSAAIARGTHIGEKLPHSLIIGALIVAAPYVWGFIGPAVEPLIPWKI